MKHLKRFGAIYILAALFLGSWLGQAIAMSNEPAREFWGATFENWQSEWLQLVFQGIFLLALKHQLFKADSEDAERLEAKIDKLVDQLGD